MTAADGGGDTIVAVAYFTENGFTGGAAFAPDGKRVAYVLGGWIYVQEIL